MCELMGLCFARPLAADFTIRPFALRDDHNADGWGLAWYPDFSVALVKEPLSWRQSAFAKFLESYERVRSSVFIGHVRRKTVGGEPTHADTHPFVRELGGREYCFAHNGTVHGAGEQFSIGRYEPVGATDSEYLFCHLLERIEHDVGHLDDPASWRWLHDTLRRINEGGRLNMLLTDGRRLFCYHDINRWVGLFLRKVGFDRERGQMRQLEDEGMDVDLQSDTVNHGTIVASYSLDGSPWHPFEPGELMVLHKERIVFSSHRSGHATGGTAKATSDRR